MRRLFSTAFLILGTVILLATTVGVLFSLDAPAAVLSVPEEAEKCAGEVIEALSRGDIQAAQRRIYGLSEPADSWKPSDEAGALIWQAYLDSITCESSGEGYATQTGMAWDVTVSTVDISKITAAAAEYAGLLLAEQEVSGEQADALLLEGAEAAILAEEDRIVRDLKLNLIQTDGTWYVLPDAQLLKILSGNLKE